MVGIVMVGRAMVGIVMVGIVAHRARLRYAYGRYAGWYAGWYAYGRYARLRYAGWYRVELEEAVVDPVSAHAANSQPRVESIAGHGR